MGLKLKKGLKEYPVFKKVIISNYWSIVLNVFLFGLFAFFMICLFANVIFIAFNYSFSFIIKSFLLWFPVILTSLIIIAEYVASKYEKTYEKEVKIGYVKK